MEALLDLVLAAVGLDQLVAGVGLLDLRVELAGALPLRDEVRLRPLRDRPPSTTIDSGTVSTAISASSGEIHDHHHQDAEDGEHRRSPTG